MDDTVICTVICATCTKHDDVPAELTPGQPTAAGSAHAEHVAVGTAAKVIDRHLAANLDHALTYRHETTEQEAARITAEAERGRATEEDAARYRQRLARIEARRAQTSRPAGRRIVNGVAI